MTVKVPMAKTMLYGGFDGNVVEWRSLCSSTGTWRGWTLLNGHGMWILTRGDALLSEAGLCQFCAKTIERGGRLSSILPKDHLAKWLDFLRFDLIVVDGIVGAENA